MESRRNRPVAARLVAMGGLASFACLGSPGCSTVSDPGGVLGNLEAGEQVASRPLPRKKHEKVVKRGYEVAGPPPPGHPVVVGGVVPGWIPGQDKARACQLTWSFIGPRPIREEFWSEKADCSGRVISIAPHPIDANTCYIASASGGIWKTTNKGDTWVPLTDGLSTLNHGAVILEPGKPDTVYAGTGEYTMLSRGDGLFRSEDAGLTWAKVAGADKVGPTCSGIVINPDDTDEIWITGTGGCHRSLDRGVTWEEMTDRPASCIRMSPSDPKTVYIGVVGLGLMFTTDGGATFALRDFDLDADDIARIVMDVAPSDSSVLYVAVINPAESLEGLFKSNDGGDTFTELVNTPDFPGPQGTYDAYVTIDPTDPQVVWCGGVDDRYAVNGVIRSTDGGDTWEEWARGLDGSQLHPDHHAMAFGPDGTIWEGNDGGIWTCQTAPLITWKSANTTLGVTQIYQISLNDWTVEDLIAGTQDNGAPERINLAEEWDQVTPGDGGYGAYDGAAGILYTASVAVDEPSGRPYPYLVRRDANGGTDITGGWPGDLAEFIAPVVRAGDNPKALMVGTERVWHTPDATVDPPTWTDRSGNGIAGGGVLTSIAACAGDSKHVYSGSSNGNVYYTSNIIGGVWNDRYQNLPAGRVSDIVVDPVSPTIAYLSLQNDDGGRIYRTFNAGVDWENMTGTLPVGVAVTALAVDWSVRTLPMIVGSGAGIYFSSDGGATWEKNCADLPNVNIGDIQIDQGYQFAIAGTYGRGAWRAMFPPADFCPDIDDSGFIDTDDFDLFVWYFEMGHPMADFDNSGFVDLEDYHAFIVAYEFGESC